MKIEYEATANHIGYFVVKLCTNVPSNKQDPPQSCFDENILLNTGGEHDGKNTYPMCSPPMHRDIWQHQGVCKDPRDKDRNTWHTWEVRIPPHLHCKHCILQVDWKAGNQGRCWDLNDCPARNQEHFVTCSDIRIIPSGTPVPPEKGVCPKTHMYAYNNGKWCCQTNKDCKNKCLTKKSECCQHYAYKQCPATECKNNPKALDDPNVCTTTTPCKNERKHCAYWEKQGYCNRSHVRFMKKYCKKSCKVCN